jgi:ATP-dependent RNA helicase DeaD
MLSAIERLTGQRITVASVPSLAALSSARLARTKAELVTLLDRAENERLETELAAIELAGSESAGNESAEAPVARPLDEVRSMISELSAEYDPLAVAAAAVRLAQAAAGTPSDEEEIPVISPNLSSRGGAVRSPRGTRPERGPGRERGAGDRPPKAGTARLFVAAGRAAGIRPQDIVGALANESQLSGRDIGTIQIHERHALVEVPEAAADEVLRELRGSTMLKGRRANVRRDRAS